MTGADVNDGHRAFRQLDAHGNPVGTPERIEFDLRGADAGEGCGEADPARPAGQGRGYRAGNRYRRLR